MKRLIASAGTLVLAAAMLASCSAYNNPDKYISIPELSSITISQAELDKTLQEQIDEIRENSRKEDFKEIEEASILGDQVNINYEGKSADESVTLSEEALSGMKAEKHDLILGSGSFIGEYTDKDGNVVTKGFEEQIIGMKAGETKEITVTFPDSYSNNTELQGKKIIFTVTVNTVSRLTVDEKCLVKVEYTFTDPNEEDKKTEDKTENDGSASANSGAADDSLEDTKDEAEETVDFDELFADDDFEIDYTAEADKDETFNEIFKIADVRDLFKGKHKYEKIEHKLTVPADIEDKDYKAYAGKEITVTFNIDSATVLPEWNDELVTEYSSEAYTTVAAFEDALKKDIKESAAYEAVMAAVTVNEYPEKETEEFYKEYYDQMLNQQIQKVSGDSTLTIDRLTAAQLKEYVDETTQASIRDSAASQALTTVKERLILEYLFEELDITLSKDDYKKELEAYYNDYTANYMYYYYYYYGVMFTSKEDMETYYGKEELEVQFKAAKMTEVLAGKVTVTE